MSKSQYNLTILPISSVKLLESSSMSLQTTSPHKLFKISSGSESRMTQPEFHTTQVQSPKAPVRPLQQRQLGEPRSASNFFKRSQSRISDLSRTTEIDSRLVVPKYTEKEQIVRLYLSKVISNRSYNIAKCFRKWKTGEGSRSQQKKTMKGNMWFQRAALKLAKCSHITTQKSLWRLMIDPEPKAVTRAQIRTINMTVIPQQIVNFYKERDLLLQVDGLIWEYQLREAVDRFRRNCQNRLAVRRYLTRLTANLNSRGLFALRKLEEFSASHQTQRKKLAKSLLGAFLSKQLMQRNRMLMSELRRNHQLGRQTQMRAISRICESVHLQLHRVLARLHEHSEVRKSHLRVRKLESLADQLQAAVTTNVRPLFSKPRYNRELYQDRFEKLNKIYSKFSKDNLVRCFGRWRGCKNAWFVRASKRLALNSQIDLQRSLWRLYEHAGLKRETSGSYGLIL